MQYTALQPPSSRKTDPPPSTNPTIATTRPPWSCPSNTPVFYTVPSLRGSYRHKGTCTGKRNQGVPSHRHLVIPPAVIHHRSRLPCQTPHHNTPPVHTLCLTPTCSQLQIRRSPCCHSAVHVQRASAPCQGLPCGQAGLERSNVTAIFEVGPTAGVACITLPSHPCQSSARHTVDQCMCVCVYLNICDHHRLSVLARQAVGHGSKIRHHP